MSLVTLYAIFFNIAPHMGITIEIIFAMFFLSPFLIIYMAYVILKYGKPSGNTFDERFYDDLDYRRMEKRK